MWGNTIIAKCEREQLSVCQVYDKRVTCPRCTLPLSHSQLGLTPASQRPLRG